MGNISGKHWRGSDMTIVMAANVPVEPIHPAFTQGTPIQTLTPGRSPKVQGEQNLLPPLTTQATNLFQSVVAFVGDGCGIVDDAMHRRRLDICRTCDRLSGDRCTACGCFINVKARGRIFSCPIGRW